VILQYITNRIFSRNAIEAIERKQMKQILAYVLIIALIFLVSCSKVSPDAVELGVDFSWEGFSPCGVGNHPEIRVNGIPDGTKTLVVKLHDHGLSHGKQSLPYDGSGIIKQGTLDKIESPCPIGDPGHYEYKIEALNENKVIIGIGSRVRYYPEEK
jgi:hypothetical protein